MLGTKTDRAGRAIVDPFLKVVDAPRVFVVGDMASVMQNEHPVPRRGAGGDSGRAVRRAADREGAEGQEVKRPFRYFDKGNIAVVGKNYAVLERGSLRTGSFLTWLVWVFVHVLSLPQLQNRLRVQHQWLWSYFTGQRSSLAHPRTAPDRAGHGSKVADVMTVAHDQPSTNCFFVLRGRKRLPNLCKRSAGARLVRPSGAGGIDGTNGCRRCVAIFDASIRRKALGR